MSNVETTHFLLVFQITNLSWRTYYLMLLLVGNVQPPEFLFDLLCHTEY